MVYVVFDDALRGNHRGWTPDTFAETLRAPLAAIGVRIMRLHGEGRMSAGDGFQASGCPADIYEAKLDQVEAIVDAVLRHGPV